MLKPLVVSVGELMLRLSAPGREAILQSPRFETCFGGAEANVAVALSRLGTPSRFVSSLPHDALGDAAVAALRGHGVDVAQIGRVAGRLGLYFMAMGAGPRSSNVIYDREGSTFALAGVGSASWSAALAGAEWLHVSGVSLAVSEAAQESAMAAIVAARAAGVKVSFDCNFRPKLWEARGVAAAPFIDAALALADLAFANHRDLHLLTGEVVNRDSPEKVQEEATEKFFARFPRLTWVAAVTRDVESHDCQTLTAAVHRRDGAAATSRPWALSGIVDRVGGGDAFAAGLLHMLVRGESLQATIDFAAATGALKHTVPGDFFLLDHATVQRALEGRADIQR